MSEILNQIPVPSGWTSAPIWSHFRRTKRTGFQDEELLSVYRDYGVIPRASRDDNFNKASDDLSGYQLVEPGDLVVNKMKAWQGSLGVSEYRGIVSPAYFVYALQSDLDVRFTHYLLRSQPYASWYRAISKGIRPNQWDLIPEDFGRVPVLAPPLPEQLAIADFLDRETAQIDAMIDAQERLVALLGERTHALLAHAVSGRTGECSATKPSGLRWAGDVPEHWEVGNIRRYAAMKTGHTPSRQRPEYWEDCTIPWFTLADVWQLRQGRTHISKTSQQISELGLANSAAELLPAGTVMLSRTASVGFSGIMTKPMATSQDYWNWVCGPKLVPEYLLYTFRASFDDLRSLTAGSTHKTIYEADAAALRVVIPPVNEQRHIVKYLAEHLARMDAMVSKAQESMALMKERRSALISAAVTGRIDVRTGIEQVERDHEEARV